MHSIWILRLELETTDAVLGLGLMSTIDTIYHLDIGPDKFLDMQVGEQYCN